MSLSFSPSPPSSSSPPSRVDTTTEHRLLQARLILEYEVLNDHYKFGLRRLHSLMTEVDSLRHKNAALRNENSDLLNRIHISVSSSSSISHPSYHQHILDFGSQNVNTERNSLPKSISVRSTGYLKIKQGSHGFGGEDRQASQLSSDLVSSQKVCVSTKGEKEALELEVYRQGMTKTELCNKCFVTDDE